MLKRLFTCNATFVHELWHAPALSNDCVMSSKNVNALNVCLQIPINKMFNMSVRHTTPHTTNFAYHTDNVMGVFKNDTTPLNRGEKKGVW